MNEAVLFQADFFVVVCLNFLWFWTASVQQNITTKDIPFILDSFFMKLHQ